MHVVRWRRCRRVSIRTLALRHAVQVISKECIVSYTLHELRVLSRPCDRRRPLYVPETTRLRSHTWGWFCNALNYWDVFLGDISFYLVIEFVSSFSSRSYPTVRKCTDYCGMNMSTNMALKTRTRCYSFDQSVPKCNGGVVVKMMNKKRIIFPSRVICTVLLLLCVKHHAHRNINTRREVLYSNIHTYIQHPIDGHNPVISYPPVVQQYCRCVTAVGKYLPRW